MTAALWCLAGLVGREEAMNFDTLYNVVTEADKRAAGNHLTFDYNSRDADIIVSWRGEEIGRFEHRGSGCVSGSATYRKATFDTDCYSLDGIPSHWLDEKLTLLCQLQDSLAATEKAA